MSTNPIIVLLPLLLFYGVFGAIWLIGYLVNGFGLYNMAKKQGVPNGWMAFIPFVRSYFQGMLAGEVTVGRQRIKNPGLWLLLLPILFGVVIGILYALLLMNTVTGATMLERGYGSRASSAYVIRFLFSFLGWIIPFILVALAGQAAIATLKGLVNYQIHRRYVPETRALLHMLLGLFIPLYQAFYFLHLGKLYPIAPPPVEPKIEYIQ